MSTSVSVLVVHPDRKAQRIVHRILGGTGVRVELAGDLARAAELLEATAPRLVIAGTGVAHDAGAAAFFERVRAVGAEICMTLLGSAAFDRVPELLGASAVGNLLAHDMPVLAEELTTTVHKLMRRDVFGVEKYLLWGTELHETMLAHSRERAGAGERLEGELRAREQSARVAQMVRLVADELISNAVHNAPIDGAGTRYRKDLPRDAELPLDARHRVRMRWGCDGRYVAVEVSDWFGSLDRDTALAALVRQETRHGAGGAGVGLAMAYHSCDHLVFNLAAGQRTEVIALVDVRYPPAEQPPASSYNVFVESVS